MFATRPTPARAHRRSKRAPKKKSPIGGIVCSGVAIVIMLFTMGFFPSVSNVFSNLDDNLRSHNDAIVAGIIHSIPLVIFSIGTLGLAAFALRSVTRPRQSRSA